jgi:hypothetical protein
MIRNRERMRLGDFSPPLDRGRSASRTSEEPCAGAPYVDFILVELQGVADFLTGFVPFLLVDQLKCLSGELPRAPAFDGAPARRRDKEKSDGDDEKSEDPKQAFARSAMFANRGGDRGRSGDGRENR